MNGSSMDLADKKMSLEVYSVFYASQGPIFWELTRIGTIWSKNEEGFLKESTKPDILQGSICFIV